MSDDDLCSLHVSDLSAGGTSHGNPPGDRDPNLPFAHAVSATVTHAAPDPISAFPTTVDTVHRCTNPTSSTQRKPMEEPTMKDGHLNLHTFKRNDKTHNLPCQPNQTQGKPKRQQWHIPLHRSILAQHCGTKNEFCHVTSSNKNS